MTSTHCERPTTLHAVEAEFFDRFHASHPDVPVVMLTAYWSDFLDREIGARDFITLRRKPIDCDELARLLPPRTIQP